MFVKKRKCLEGCYFGLLTKSLIYFSLFFRFIFFFSFVLFSNLTFAGRWFSLWFSPTDWDLVDGGRGFSGLGEGLISGHVLLMTEWRVFLPLNHSVRLGFVICTLAFYVISPMSVSQLARSSQLQFLFCQFTYFVCKLPAIWCQSQHDSTPYSTKS